MTNDEREGLIAFLDTRLLQLGEHFEHVQILVSNQDESGTWTMARGLGNWNARQGMAQRFIKDDEAQEAARFVANELNHED